MNACIILYLKNWALYQDENPPIDLVLSIVQRKSRGFDITLAVCLTPFWQSEYKIPNYLMKRLPPDDLVSNTGSAREGRKAIDAVISAVPNSADSVTQNL